MTSTAIPTDATRLRPIISAEQLTSRAQELGRKIRADYGDSRITLLAVLKGSFVFTADLARNIEGDVEIEFLGVASYGNQMESSGAVKITLDPAAPLEGKHVVLVEDIVDTGLTLAYLMRVLAARHPASLKICALLEKPSGNSPVKPDYVGFSVGREFVVGYGLDWAQRYRNLPYVAAVEVDDAVGPPHEQPSRDLDTQT